MARILAASGPSSHSSRAVLYTALTHHNPPRMIPVTRSGQLAVIVTSGVTVGPGEASGQAPTTGGWTGRPHIALSPGQGSFMEYLVRYWLVCCEGVRAESQCFEERRNLP